MEKLIVIVGQTSSGKSDLAIKLAEFFGGEIVSADSRQVYKNLDWCSGKVSKEERRQVKHHLLDVINLGEQFTLYDFQKLAYEKIDEIIMQKKLPFLVGGTGLYTRAVAEGYALAETKPNFELREELSKKSLQQLKQICKEKKIDFAGEVTCRRLIRLLEKNASEKDENIVQKNKPRYEVLTLGIKWPREEIYERINLRLGKRIPHMIEEIKSLLARGISEEFLMSLGLEAKHIILYLKGEHKTYDEFFETLLKEERHFAKRQATWYNKEKNIVWLDAHGDIFENAKKEIEKFLTKN